jgi:hypothetical protein
MLGLSCSIMVGAKFGLGAPDSGTLLVGMGMIKIVTKTLADTRQRFARKMR